VLTHEGIADLLWSADVQSLLLKNDPNSPAQIKESHARVRGRSGVSSGFVEFGEHVNTVFRMDQVFVNMGHANIYVTQNVYNRTWWEERVEAVSMAAATVWREFLAQPVPATRM